MPDCGLGSDAHRRFRANWNRIPAVERNIPNPNRFCSRASERQRGAGGPLAGLSGRFLLSRIRPLANSFSHPATARLFDSFLWNPIKCEGDSVRAIFPIERPATFGILTALNRSAI